MTGRVRLSRDRVLAAAVALADREGVEALTVRRLADDLGVHPTSLYNHVASKEAILDGVVEVLFSEAQLPEPDATWQQWVGGMAISLRGLARAHPGAFMVLTRRPAESPRALDQSELGLQAFLAAGFSTAQAVAAVRGVSLALLGLALNECPPMGDWVDPQSGGTAWDDRPRLREIAADLRPEDESAHWDLVVAALTAGLERQGA